MDLPVVNHQDYEAQLNDDNKFIQIKDDVTFVIDLCYI